MRRRLLATGLLLCHWLALGWAAPWAVNPKNPPVSTSPVHVPITGRLGGQLRIICPVQADPEPIVEWYRDGVRIKEYSDRYKLSGLTLFIKQLECDDQGTYVCMAINGYGTLKIAFILEITRSKDSECHQVDDEETVPEGVDSAGSVPVILQRAKSDKHLLKPAGSQVSIKCPAVGKPSPTVRWFKDNVEISRFGKKFTVKETSNKSGRQADAEDEDEEDEDSANARHQVVRSVLQVTNLTGNDTANYTCRASNGFGSADFTFHLEVVERQEPRVPEMHPHYPSNSSFVAGQPASLSCKAKSEFPPTMHWLKRLPDASAPPEGQVDIAVDPTASVLDLTPNRTLVNANVRYLILQSPKSVLVDNFYLSKLTFGQVSAEADAGGYVCLVINDAGFIYREVYLAVVDPHDKSEESGLSGGSDPNSTVAGSAMSEADSATTAVVIFVVIVGLGTMVAVCLAWKRRSRHVKENFLSGVAAPKSSTSSLQIGREAAPGGSGAAASESGSLLASNLPPAYPVFRDGLSRPMASGADASPSIEASGAAYGPALNQNDGVVYFPNGRPPVRRTNPPRRSHRSPRTQRAHRHRDDPHKRRNPAGLPAPQRSSCTPEELALPITWEKRSARLARPSPESSFDNGSLLL